MQVKEKIKDYLYESLLQESQKVDKIFLEEWFNGTLEEKEDFELSLAYIKPRITLSEKGRLKMSSGKNK